ncbi:TolC family outer membrane protein [Erwinia sp. CGal63]|uniref:TolC family outer membrane protein n=1 Tax=Erwinia sp. CGal63 TaxID=2919889 RepID=UPI0030091BD1
MEKRFIAFCCLLVLPYASLAQLSSPVKPAPDGFWGVFSGTPDNDPAEVAQLSAAADEAEMQPPDGGGRVPVEWRAAVLLAVNHHPAISSSVATLESAGFGVDNASAGYLPAIKAGITSGRQQDEDSGQIATLGLSQMLYDFGKTGSAVDRATASYLRQQASLLAQIDSVIEQTALALNEVFRYTRQLENARKQVRALRDILRLTELRAAAGASTRVDPVQAQARVEAAEAQQQESEIKLRQARYHLQALLGQPVADRPLSAPPDLQPLIRQIGAKLDLNRNPAVLMAQADAAIASAELRNSKAQRYPTLSLEASSNKYIGDISRYQSRSQYQNVYLSLNSTLYQGGALAAQENASARALAAAREAVNSQKLELTDRQRNAFQSMKGLQSNINILSRRLRTITETRALYREQYLALGNRNVLDLLNAEQEISRAELDLINARSDLWAAAVEYIVLAGWAREAFSIDPLSVQGSRQTADEL